MNYLIVDGNSLGNAANETTALYVGDEQVNAVFGFIKSLRMIMAKHRGYIPIVLWDGKSQSRRDLFPLYKGNREAKTAEQAARKAGYKSQVPKIMELLETLGVRQLLDYTQEADDLAGYLAENLKAEEIVLITGDKDWQQLVRENVIWQDHRTDAVCSLANFESITGYKNTRAFLEGKALVGDTSDNIPGVGGIGKETAPVILKEHGSVEAFLNFWTRKICEGEKAPKWVSNFVNNLAPKDSIKYGKMLPTQEAFERNMALMELAGYKPNKANLLNKKGKYNREAFQNLCQELMFNSLLVQLGTWIKPFENVANK